jgi:hypothetical protein
VRCATAPSLAQHDETRDNRTMGRFFVAFAIVTALAAPARAELLRLSAEVQGGEMYGRGTEGDQKDNAFFAKSPHPFSPNAATLPLTYGVLLTGEILFFNVSIQHQQFWDPGNQLTTWSQLGLGVHFQFDTGDEKLRKAHKSNFYEIGGGLFLGLGTPIQVKPPLDNAQLSDKGFLVEGRFGFGKHLDSVFDILVTVPVSYGFFTKPNDSGCSANNLSCDYRSIQVEALVALRATLRLL